MGVCALENALVRRVQRNPRRVIAARVLTEKGKRVRIRVEEIGSDECRVSAGKDCEVDHDVVCRVAEMGVLQS